MSCFDDGSHLVVWRCSIDCMNSADAATAQNFLIYTIDQREGAQMWHLRRMLWCFWMLSWHNWLDYWSAGSEWVRLKFYFNQALSAWLTVTWLAVTYTLSNNLYCFYKDLSLVCQVYLSVMIAFLLLFDLQFCFISSLFMVHQCLKVCFDFY